MAEPIAFPSQAGSIGEPPELGLEGLQVHPVPAYAPFPESVFRDFLRMREFRFDPEAMALAVFQRAAQKLGATAATQITGDAEEFPIYGRSEDSRDLIHDLAAQMNFGPAAFRFEIVEDIRDTYGLPYQMQDAPLNVEVLREEAGCVVHTAKSILDSLEFAAAAVYAMAKARLEGAYGLPAGDPEGKLAKSFLELAAIHMGYGAFLLRHGTDFKVQDDGLWQRTSGRRTSIPNPEIAYAMAVAFEEADLAKPLALPKPIPSLIRVGMAEYAADVSNMLPSGIDARPMRPAPKGIWRKPKP